MDEDSDCYKREGCRLIQEEPKIDKVGKFWRKVVFLENGMQRGRTKIQKLQQDPTVTPFMSMVELRSKQFIDLHDYHIMEQGKGQDTHDNYRHIGPYFTYEQQIKADFSRQIYEEEQK